MAGPGKARLGGARPDKAGQTWRGKAGRGSARPDEAASARLGVTRNNRKEVMLITNCNIN